jgi:hypothetical protein
MGLWNCPGWLGLHTVSKHAFGSYSSHFGAHRDCLSRILVGYGIAYASYLPWIHKDSRIRRQDPDALRPESRLYWLLYSKSESLKGVEVY